MEIVFFEYEGHTVRAVRISGEDDLAYSIDDLLEVAVTSARSRRRIMDALHAEEGEGDIFEYVFETDAGTSVWSEDLDAFVEGMEHVAGLLTHKQVRAVQRFADNAVERPRLRKLKRRRPVAIPFDSDFSDHSSKEKEEEEDEEDPVEEEEEEEEEEDSLETRALVSCQLLEVLARAHPHATPQFQQRSQLLMNRLLRPLESFVVRHVAPPFVVPDDEDGVRDVLDGERTIDSVSARIQELGYDVPDWRTDDGARVLMKIGGEAVGRYRAHNHGMGPPDRVVTLPNGDRVTRKVYTVNDASYSLDVAIRNHFSGNKP